MSDLALFMAGTIVFFLGGVGLVLFGLDTFQGWLMAGKQPDEERHLDEELVRDVLRPGGRRRDSTR
jgi:hypothetical protein